MKHASALGDLVLELDDNPHSAWNAALRGPCRIEEFLHNGAVAVLATGATQCKPSVIFNRHVSRLTKYIITKYTA